MCKNDSGKCLHDYAKPIRPDSIFGIVDRKWSLASIILYPYSNLEFSSDMALKERVADKKREK